ncbi:hypothetical protein BGX23_002509 [Mortierella sp. AD031]|nr:hypothetical protein BGX23_002509 [Mortierella sp. AD031]
MMDTAENHSARPQALPSKLRWRPYSNGTTKSTKRQKKDDSGPQENSNNSQQLQNQTLGLNAKAFAHKVREKSFRSAKDLNPPVGVQLQWEEAETIESMSHGGHPHNQHPPIGVSSLPSPSPSKSPTTTPARAQPGELDLSHYKARLPGLTGDDFLEHGLPLPSIEANTVYQVALNDLLENHRKNMLAEKAPALAITSAVNPPATLPDSTPSQQRKLSSSELLGISTIEELLASCGYTEPIGNYPGDTTMTAIRIPISPATTDQSLSLHSSPVNGIMDLQGTTAFQTPKTPLDISSASFDLLMAQTPVLLSEGDSKQILLQQQLQQQQQQTYGMGYSQTGLSGRTTPSPFSHAATIHDDPLINGNDSTFSWNWPSLFPKVSVTDSTRSIARETNTGAGGAAAPRVDIAIQTDSSPMTEASHNPLSPSLSGSAYSADSSPMTHLGLTQEELDPDWLTFLEENSPLFPAVSESSSSESPEPSSPSTFTTADANTATPPTTTTTTPMVERKAESVTPPVRKKGTWNWAEDFLKQGAMAPTGHRTFPTAGSLGTLGGSRGGGGGGGGGGMIRTLRGTGGNGIGGSSGSSRYQQHQQHQQRSGYHTQAFGRTGSGTVGGSRGGSTGDTGGNGGRGMNAVSVGESARIPGENTMQENKTTSSEKDESPGKKNPAEEEPRRGGGGNDKVKLTGTDTTATTSSTNATTARTTEGFGGLLAMFRGLWKGNGGDKNDT